MPTNEWIRVLDSLPAERVLVETKIDDDSVIRNVQKMIYYRNLWWIHFGERGEMYVYYRPTHWRGVR